RMRGTSGDESGCTGKGWRVRESLFNSIVLCSGLKSEPRTSLSAHRGSAYSDVVPDEFKYDFFLSQEPKGDARVKRQVERLCAELPVSASLADRQIPLRGRFAERHEGAFPILFVLK